jgi:hypothetical protein
MDNAQLPAGYDLSQEKRGSLSAMKLEVNLLSSIRRQTISLLPNRQTTYEKFHERGAWLRVSLSSVALLSRNKEASLYCVLYMFHSTVLKNWNRSKIHLLKVERIISILKNANLFADVNRILSLYSLLASPHCFHRYSIFIGKSILIL